jgi:hypothetical protein
MDAETRRRILHPEPGTPLAEAQAYGIDLTQVLEAVELTLEQRIERALSSVQSMLDLREHTVIRAR